MRAGDVMSTKVITVTPDTGVQEIAKTLLENRISSVPVVDANGKIVGMVSDDDLMRRPELETEPHHSWWLSLLLAHEAKTAEYIKTHGRCAQHVMSRGVHTVREDDTLEQVAETLQRNRIKSVPVMRDGKLAGIVARSDLLHGLIARQNGQMPTADDEAIKVQFGRELRKADVDPSYLNYLVCGGVVHVWGVVMSPPEKDAIRLAARSVSGVTDISMHVDALSPEHRRAMRE